MTDKRFSAIKSMIEADMIKNFKDIFEIVPKTVLSTAVRMNAKTLDRKAEKVGLFTLDEVRNLSEVFGVDFITMVNIIIKSKSVSKRTPKG